MLQFLLNRVKAPMAHYVKIFSVIALLILVWVGGDDAPFGPKLILTTIACSSLWNGYLSLKRRTSQ
jgi:hypothetical protein